jgi:G3E family GTPase
VLDCLIGYGGEIEKKNIIVLIDAMRFQKLKDLSIPIIADGVAVADIIVINKIDQVAGEHLDTLKARIDSLRPGAPIVCMSAIEEISCDDLLAALPSPAASGQPSMPPAPAVPTAPNMPPPVTHAGKVRLTFASPVASQALSQELANLLAGISKALGQGDADMLGHVKAIVQTKGQGFLMLSAVSARQPVAIKGKLAASLSDATLTINAILYGHQKQALEEAVQTHLAAFAAQIKHCTMETCRV